MVEKILEMLWPFCLSFAWFCAGRAYQKSQNLSEYMRGFDEGFEVCRDYLKAYHEGELNQLHNLLAKASQRRKGQKDLDHDS